MSDEIAPIVPTSVPIGTALERLLRGLAERVESRMSLPCYPDDPAIHPPGSLRRAVAACERVRGWDGCRWHAEAVGCPRQTLASQGDELVTRLNVAGVEAEERARLIAHASGRQRLLDTQALRVVRAFMEGRAGAFVDNDEPAAAEPVRLLGDETILVMIGARGRGKTLAACWAIGAYGGAYTTAYNLVDPSDRAGRVRASDLCDAPGVVVVDQMGRESLSASGWSLSEFERLVDARYAARRKLILCANLPADEFRRRYQGIIADRLDGRGCFAVLSGKASLRVALRGA